MMEPTLVRQRVELKYVLPRADSEELISRLPGPEEGGFQRRFGRVATVYFDRPDHSLTRRALGAPQTNVKVRVREYLTPDGIPSSPFLWVEMKERDGASSRKHRFQLHKRLVGRFMTGELDLASILSCQGPHVTATEALEAVRQIRALAQGPLVAVGSVEYLRTSLETRDPCARLTIDREIRYERGPASWAEPGTIAEVKFEASRPPTWCAALLRGFPPSDYSKFLVLARLPVSEASVA